MTRESLRSLIGLLSIAVLMGCESTTDPLPVAAEPKSASIDSPEWVDLATATPVTIAVRPDGRQVIAYASPVTHVYELPSGKRIHTWPRQLWASYSGDGKTVLTVSDSVMSVSDTQSFRPLQSFPPPLPHHTNDRPPFSAAISHDGSRIALTDLSQATDYHSPSVVRVFDCSDGTESFSILVPENTRVQSLDFLLDATRLLVQYSGSGDSRYNGARELWDLQRTEVIAQFARAAKVIVSENRKRIAVGETGQATKITIHDAATGQLQNECEHPDLLRDFTLGPDSSQVLITSAIPGSKTTSHDESGSQSAKSPISRIMQWDVASSIITFEQTDAEFPFATAMYDAEGDRIFGALEKPSGLDEDVDFYLLGWDASTSTSIRVLPQAFFNNYFGEVFFVPGSDDTVVLRKPFSLRNVTTGATSSPLAHYRIAQTHVQFKANEPSIYCGSSLTDLRSGISSSSSPVGPTGQFVQNGKTLFGSRHPSLSLFDLESGEQFWNLYLTCAMYAARDTKITKDARYIVRSQPTSDDSIDQSRILIIRPVEPDSPTVLHRYAASIAIHPSDRRFAAASDQSIEEFDIANGKLLGKIGDIPGRVLDMAYTADGSHVVACGVIDHRDPQTRFHKSSFGWAWLYDRETQQVQQLRGHTAVVTSLAIDTPRHRLATSSNDGTVRLWNMKTGECLWVYRGHHGQIHCVDISSDGKLLASAGVDGIAIWNVAGVVDLEIPPVQIASEFTWAEQPEITNETPRNVNLSTPPPSPAEGTAQWDVVKVGDTSRVHFHNASVDPWLQQNSNAHQTLQIYEIPRRPPRVPSAYGGPSSRSRDGERLLFTKFSKPYLKVFDSNYKEVQSWPIRASEQNAVISADGDLVFIVRDPGGHSSGKIHVDIYDVESGELLRTIQGVESRWGAAIDVDPLGRTLLIRFDGNSIDLREIATGKSLGLLRSTLGGAGRSAQYSPDGRLIAMGKYPDTEIMLCDPRSLKPIQTITNDFPVRWFEFTPDGKRIIAGQPYAESRTWLTMWEIDPTEATKVRRLWSHAGPAGDNGMFSDDGRRYLSQANWNLWTLWDTENGHVDVAIITSLSNTKDQFALSADGQSIHFYSGDGPQIWPSP